MDTESENWDWCSFHLPRVFQSEHWREAYARPVAPATTGWTCKGEHPGMLEAKTCERVWVGATTSRRG